MKTSVLIVGAGPAGLTAAIELRRYGVPVRIIDAAERRQPHSKALCLWSRTLELLDRAGCSAALVAAGHQVDAVAIVTDNKTIGRVDFSAVDSPHPYALMLPQAETEALLEAHLNERGVRVERGVRLALFHDDGIRVETELLHADGGRESLDAGGLVGCDGADSTVREGLGLTFQSHASVNDWVLADLHISGLAVPAAAALAAYWHEDGFLAIFPVGFGRYRVIADIGPSVNAAPATPTLTQIQTLLDRRGPGGLAVSNPVWLSGFRIQERNARQYRVGRVLIAGDAAHLHNPAGAQGMNMGMHDAVDLAWKLALIHDGTGDAEALLRSYDAERRPVADRVIANVGRLTAISMIRNAAAQTARNLLGGFLLGLAPARRLAAGQMTELSLAYRNSPMIGPDDGSFPIAVPGERLPPVPGQIPVGAGPRPLFALFAAPTEATTQFLRDFGDIMEPAERPALATSCMWLVRPDGYVAAVGLEGDIRVFYKYFETFSVGGKRAA
jgi:2-polyprenyl-6-methoxyphenol hydroxylase-like FAD-dependent oxidoreductase